MSYCGELKFKHLSSEIVGGGKYESHIEWIHPNDIIIYEDTLGRKWELTPINHKDIRIPFSILEIKNE